MPSITLFTFITVIAASRAKAVPIDGFSLYDNQLSQLLAFNDLPSWQVSTLLNEAAAATQSPQFLSLDPCADPNVESPPNCPIPKSWAPAPASEEVQPLPAYGGSIQDVPMEYPWNICGGRDPEPRPIATCSSGNPQQTVVEKADGDSGVSHQLLQSFICESISSIPSPCTRKQRIWLNFLQTTHLLISAARIMTQNYGAAGNSLMKSRLWSFLGGQDWIA